MMFSSVELKRVVSEWQTRLKRAYDVLAPANWSEEDWKYFSQAVTVLVRDHGKSWIIEPKMYWDLRWRLREGGTLIAQVEHEPDVKTTLIVAQEGGFAASVGSYTYLWTEFGADGELSRDPYFVDGTWKEALTSLLLPLSKQASYYLEGFAETPKDLLLQDGARPNSNGHDKLLLERPERYR